MLQDIIKILEKTKLFNIEVIDLKQKTDMVHYSLVCSSTSYRQRISAAYMLKNFSREYGLKFFGMEGTFENSEWVLVDLSDIVIHIMSEESRRNYSLENFFRSKLTMVEKM